MPTHKEFVDAAREVMEFVAERLPEGTHYGIVILPEGKDGPVLAMTTDRDEVAPAAARWFLNVCDPEETP